MPVPIESTAQPNVPLPGRQVPNVRAPVPRSGGVDVSVLRFTAGSVHGLFVLAQKRRSELVGFGSKGALMRYDRDTPHNPNAMVRSRSSLISGCLFPSHSMPVIDIALYEPSTYRAYTRPFLILYVVAGWWLHSCAAYSSCSIRVHATSSTRRSSQTMACYLFFSFLLFFRRG